MKFEKKHDLLDIVSVAAVGVAAAAVVAGVVYISKKCRDYITCADLIDDGCDCGCEDDECCCKDTCSDEDECHCQDADEDCACESAPSIENVVETECAMDAEKE